MMRAITTFFYVGLLRPAPGTWGSLAAIIIGCLIHMAGGVIALSIAAVVVGLIGQLAINVETKDLDDPDKSEIVVDEVLGQWIALLPVSAGAQAMGADITALWPGILAAFLLFRLFDIWKPGPIGKADRRHDATGVMLDDIIAGVFAAICVFLLAGIFHGLM